MSIKQAMSNNLKNKTRQTFSHISKGLIVALAGLCFYYVADSYEDEKTSFVPPQVKILSVNPSFTSSNFDSEVGDQLNVLSQKIQQIRQKKERSTVELENLAIWQAQQRIYLQVQDLETRQELHKADTDINQKAFQDRIKRLKQEAQQIQHAME